MRFSRAEVDYTDRRDYSLDPTSEGVLREGVRNLVTSEVHNNNREMEDGLLLLVPDDAHRQFAFSPFTSFPFFEDDQHQVLAITRMHISEVTGVLPGVSGVWFPVVSADLLPWSEYGKKHFSDCKAQHRLILDWMSNQLSDTPAPTFEAFLKRN